MTCEELCDLLGQYRAGLGPVRGRQPDRELVYVVLDADGSGWLRADLTMPGHGTSAGESGLVAGLGRGVPHEVEASFPSLDALERILRGQEEPGWEFPDE